MPGTRAVACIIPIKKISKFVILLIFFSPFFKVSVNNKLAYDYKGQTKSKGVKTYYKFGIYRSWISKYKSYHKGKEVPTQVVYFDEVRAGKTKEKVIGNLK